MEYVGSTFTPFELGLRITSHVVGDLKRGSDFAGHHGFTEGVRIQVISRIFRECRVWGGFGNVCWIALPQRYSMSDM